MRNKPPLFTLSILLAVVLLLMFSLPAVGGVKWTADGVGIRTASANDAQSPQITSDGSGGAIIAWHDKRSGSDGIYAQRVDAAGNPLWTADGVGVCTSAYTPSALYPQIVSDGAGGAIIAWQDYRDGAHNFVYAQRVNAAGSILWTAGGVGIRTAATAGNAGRPQMVCDGSGGAIITWEDDRASGSYVDIYAQRVDAAGNRLWTPEGIGVRNISANKARNPRIVSDGSGGAIITWQDDRAGHNDIYAQKVNAAGSMVWPIVDGAPIRDFSANDAALPQLCSDGSGGAIITWQDGRDGHGDIYAQRVDAAGIRTWTPDGVGIRTAAANNAQSPRITSDGSGAAVIAWHDRRSGSKWDIYAQKVNGAGDRLWTADGVGVRTAPPGDTNGNCIVSDGYRGAIVTWQDYRDGHYDIYTQRLDAAGNPAWTDQGMGVRTAPPGDSGFPQMISSGSGGATVTWQDYRDGHYDIYAQSISRAATTWYLAEGATAGDFETWVLVQNPNPGPVTVDLTFMTTDGPKPGPQDFPIAGSSRQSFKVNSYVSDFNVSTKVESSGGDVICERAMYGGNKTWAHDSIGYAP